MNRLRTRAEINNEPLMVVAFDNQHRIGSICAAPCEQCGEESGKLGTYTHSEGDVEVLPVMRIVAPATYGEYLESVRRANSPLNPALARDCYFYKVVMD